MDDAYEKLREALGTQPEILCRAPGRANLMGEHTDYNDGLVLPVAIDMATYVGGVGAGTIRVRSLQAGEVVTVDPTTGDGPGEGWGAFVTGVVKALLEDGIEVGGFDGVVSSDVPIGAGLSSSAALEVAVAKCLINRDVTNERLARVCQRAENDHVGMRCGIMDQMTSVSAIEGHAMLLDCRDLSIKQVNFPKQLVLLLIDSGCTRELTSTGYNQRRYECENAADALGIGSLRDASVVAIEDAGIDSTLERRVRHVLTENERVVEVASALERDDRNSLRETFAASHESLRDDFEASTPEIDELVAIATATAGVVGTRLTGGGFGGCTVSLVDAGAKPEEIARSICRRYARVTGKEPRWWLTRPGSGASRL